MSDTREYIIDQAYTLFLSRSYEAVSINDISKAIGFTKGALYHHFTNKEELFKAVIDKYLPFEDFLVPLNDLTLEQYVEESIKISEKIVYNILGEKPKFIPISYLSLFIDAFRHYPKFAKEKDRLIQQEIEKIAYVIKKAIENGEARKDIDPEVMAMNFFTISLGIASNLTMNNSPKEAIEILRKQMFQLYNIMKV
jgi:AcrR family transcriptional regulator